MNLRFEVLRKWTCAGLVVSFLLAGVVYSAPTAAQEQRQEQVNKAMEERLQALQRQTAELERQILMLREQMQELNAMLERALGGRERDVDAQRERDAVRRERDVDRREGGEREVARRHIEIMKLALPALEEVGRKDTAELLEKAIRAREVSLEGRRDAEANRIREQAPKLGQEIEIVTFASRIWREAGNVERADALAQLAEELRDRGDRRRDREIAQREEGRERRGATEREVAERQLEVMKMALKALLEGERRDMPPSCSNAPSAHGKWRWRAGAMPKLCAFANKPPAGRSWLKSSPCPRSCGASLATPSGRK